MNIEEMIPHRLQVVISPDGHSIRTKVTHEQRGTMFCYHIWNRLSSIRVRLHRLFIFPKDGVTESERMRHVQALGDVCQRHLLILSKFPQKLIMNHLVAYTFVNTGVAVALTLIACPGVLDDSFFIPQLNRIVKSLTLAQHSLTSSLARKAVVLLNALISQAESLTSFTEPPFKRHCGFHQARKTSTVQSDSDADSLEHKVWN
ncbi:hypothetical protein CROQUDRAFT_653511 [Cronartium quercuum f. sp. fusiforme G11]|uniref:Uncharacterized protein n=1 Tax=Cronartium quercuum f. sp. fusiforme G11 TaxID=708437 RepID=A0A9P6NSR2_9BASI|nr:hypothetical protein CROQUDRAFT_653511 [Cronartium quercuum f. sp. fusiforme G11]